MVSRHRRRSSQTTWLSRRWGDRTDLLVVAPALEDA